MKTLKYLFLLCLFFPVLSFARESALVAGDLKCEALVNPLAIDNIKPHLSWIVYTDGTAGESQTAYQILVASSEELLNETDADIWNSGKVFSSESAWINYEGAPLTSKSFVFWKVRVWDKSDAVSRWSAPAYFGIGLLQSEDWTAHYIGMPEKMDKFVSPLLRKTFRWKERNARAFLHVNSLGYHEVYVNGKAVSDAVLTPAVSQYNKRSLSVTYDVTSFLKDGENDIVLWLGKGWYNEGLPGVVEGGPFVRAQLEVQKRGTWQTCLVTDNSWKAAENGYFSFGTWRSYQFGGEIIDARNMADLSDETALKALSWHPVRVVEIPEHAVTPQMAELNRIRQSFHPIAFQASGDTAWIFDMGTNFTGWTKIQFPALPEGHQVRISYCDFLDDKNQFRDGQYEDYYIASGRKPEIFLNKFNYKAYRYIKLSNLEEAPALSDVTGYLVRTDYSGNSSFECSDSDMNAIHDMVHYTLQCLTLGGDMVDCPQIERLGYGGDGNASTPTIQMMYNLAPLYMNWMQAWADCMREDGSMPHTAPNPYLAGGGPFWCGFIITASWQTYLNYGDVRLLERYYPYMQQWLEYVKKYTVNGLLTAWPNTDYRQWYLGDWATPTGIDQTDSRSVDLVNNCFVAVCYQTMAKIAGLLGNSEDKALYLAKDEALRKLIHETFYDTASHSYGSGTQIDLIYPMLAGVTPSDCLDDVRETLRKVTAERFNGHLATGLVGVPVITEWATENRAAEFMYSMLKKRDYPGYLYMIDNGATTTWEHWNGARSHIHNCYNGIGSWFYSALAGIQPDDSAAGYRRVIIAPQLVSAISWVKAKKETPYGMLEVSWEKSGNMFTMNVQVPSGCMAQVDLPVKASRIQVNGETKNPQEKLLLPSGKYRIVSEEK